MTNVLWLPSWYPSIESLQNGDFIHRQALAASDYWNLQLLFVQSSGKINRTSDGMRTVNKRFDEHIVIFPKVCSVLNFLKYLYLYDKKFREIYNDGQLPEMVHVHVSYKAGLFALWLKWKYKLPFIITEHWTYFTREKDLNYSNSNLFKKWLIRRIFYKASYVLPVSQSLSCQLKGLFPGIKTIVVPNVVNPLLFDFFGARSVSSNKFRFIHVSSLNEVKNPLKIIRVFNRVKALHNEVILEIVGAASHQLMKVIESNGYLDDSVLFYGLKEHAEVAELIGAADAFILFSTSENLPCVIAESLCSGVPVISSAVGGVPEMLDESNGILVPSGDEDALYNAMESMLLNYSRYDRKKISKDAQAKYNPETVGRQIVEVYEKVLLKK